MKRNLRLIAAAAAPVAVAFVIAGCGGSAYGSGQPAAPTANASGAAKVAVADSTLGRIVVDTGGFALYAFEKDKDGRSACSGQCATYWPPLLTNAGPVARAGVAQVLLGTTRRADGSEQITYAGHPLYRFFEDSKPGQTNGEGLQDFGAEWDVLSPGGKTIESDN